MEGTTQAEVVIAISTQVQRQWGRAFKCGETQVHKETAMQLSRNNFISSGKIIKDAVLNLVVHACNPCTKESEAGGS